jgi:hypothetical protein
MHWLGSWILSSYWQLFLFYLPHMKYEGSTYWFSVKKKSIADFYVSGHFMAKKHDLKKKNCLDAIQKLPWKLESWNFGSRTILGQLDALHTQNFEIWYPKGTSHTNFDKTVDAQFGSLAVRRKKNKMTKNLWACMICNMWKVYTRPTCASDAKKFSIFIHITAVVSP